MLTSPRVVTCLAAHDQIPNRTTFGTAQLRKKKQNTASELGLVGTVEKNILPDPANSLKALLARDLRAQVVSANQSSPALRRMNVEGVGHNYWVDHQSGFTDDEQHALILYLLTYEPNQ
jgi:hypothetical protein